MRLLIKNGRLIDPANNIDGYYDILIDEGFVKEIKPRGQIKDEATKLIDAEGMIVCPGFIDMHVHLRDPGYEYKETIETGTLSAVFGGFTSVVCMANTNPVNDNASVTKYILDKSREKAHCTVYPIGALSKGLKGEELAEYGELKEAGCVALSDDGKAILNSRFMRRAMEYAKTFGLPVISHCEDTNLSDGGLMNEGFLSTRLGLQGIPKISESIMVFRDICLSELTGCHLHIAHVSTHESVELIRYAKAKGIKVTAETAPHYFTLTEEALKDYNSYAKVNPPLRTNEDVESIKEALKDGTIDVIATDHAPHSLQEKDIEFDVAASGISGLETALALSLQLVREGYLTLRGLIEKFTINPAKILRIPEGSISPGSVANIVIFDPEFEWKIDRDKFKSLGKNTPFHGWKVKGKAMYTIAKGRIIYENKKE